MEQVALAAHPAPVERPKAVQEDRQAKALAAARAAPTVKLPMLAAVAAQAVKKRAEGSLAGSRCWAPSPCAAAYPGPKRDRNGR